MSNDLTPATTDKMASAIRIGCAASDIHLRCSYPDCKCVHLPAAIKAAVGFALMDAIKQIKPAVREAVQNAIR